jgi:Ferritin-like domain
VTALTRRAAFAGALGAALAGAAPALAAPDEGAIVADLWRREAAAELAYGAQRGVLARADVLQAHCGRHVSVLSTSLGALGVDFPPHPRRTADLDRAARALATASRAGAPAAAIALENGLVAAYRAALPAPKELKLAVALATILAAHAQHRLTLRADHGDPRLPEPQAAG